MQAIREICDTYTDRGLPNYPSGVPFTFWEQYINLRFYLSMAVLCILLVTFVVLTLVLLNPWLATIVVSLLLSTVIYLTGYIYRLIYIPYVYLKEVGW